MLQKLSRVTEHLKGDEFQFQFQVSVQVSQTLLVFWNWKSPDIMDGAHQAYVPFKEHWRKAHTAPVRRIWQELQMDPNLVSSPRLTVCSPWQDSSSTGLQSGREGFFSWENGKLLIPAARPSHAGVYTCQLTVLINNRQYKVSRTVLVQVEGE